MTRTNAITIHWSKNNTCYARIYNAAGLMVHKIDGYKRVVDLKNRAVTEFEDMFPGTDCTVETPKRWE